MGTGRELGEPSGQNGPQPAAPGEAQEAVPFPQLAVLVPASHHERVLEPHLHHRERDRVERVVGVHEQLRTHPPAGLRQLAQSIHNAGIPIKHG